MTPEDAFSVQNRNVQSPAANPAGNVTVPTVTEVVASNGVPAVRVTATA
jgi:hypothetical protein